VGSIAALRPKTTKNTRGREKHVCRANIPPGPLLKSNCYKAREIAFSNPTTGIRGASVGRPSAAVHFFSSKTPKPARFPDRSRTSTRNLTTAALYRLFSYTKWPRTVAFDLGQYSCAPHASVFHTRHVVFYILETTEFFTERRAGHRFISCCQAVFWTVTKGGLKVYEAPDA
jgi:hypothetical protein